MADALQAKLLHVLESGTVRPVGSAKQREVDVRIIAATHRNLTQAVRDGRFREDLLYRLDVVPIVLPNLRDRRDDIPGLLEHFLEEVRRKYPQSPVMRISGAALTLCALSLAWKYSRTRSCGREAGPAGATYRDFRLRSARDHRCRAASETLEFGGDIMPLRELERRYAAWALAQTGGHRGKTAEKLGVDPKTLRKFLGEVDVGGEKG